MKAPFALGALMLMIVMVVAGYQPIHVAAFIAASLAVLSGALKMREAYRAIEWRVVFLVAALLPVGIAMERTGAALFLANGVTAAAGPLGPYGILASLVSLGSLLSQALDGAPAVVLLTPVALQTTQDLGLSPYPVMMGIGLAASAAFMTPFSHKANLLVMGAGGYRAMDYIRVGTPLTIILLAIMVLMVPVFFMF
jgi:di/tricarboxylate transporter